jgi:hypothetical protein
VKSQVQILAKGEVCAYLNLLAKLPILASIGSQVLMFNSNISSKRQSDLAETFTCFWSL